MPPVPLQLACDVAPLLDRAVETGTAFGDSTTLLANIFPSVITLELSADYAAAARTRFADTASVTVLEGDSGQLLREIADPALATFYFLDAHFTGGPAGGIEIDCPIIEELAALAEKGGPRDVVVVDDVRVFADLPEGRDRSRWPTVSGLEQLLRAAYPRHRLLIAGDQMIALSARARLRVKRRALGRRAGYAVRALK